MKRGMTNKKQKNENRLSSHQNDDTMKTLHPYCELSCVVLLFTINDGFLALMCKASRGKSFTVSLDLSIILAEMLLLLPVPCEKCSPTGAEIRECSYSVHTSVHAIYKPLLT